MRNIRRKAIGFLVTVAAIMAVMPVGVMAKTNSKPAVVSKPLAVYSEDPGTQVKSLTLVKGSNNGQESVDVTFGATLTNALGSDYYLTKIEADGGTGTVEVKRDYDSKVNPTGYPESVSKNDAYDCNSYTLTAATAGTAKLKITYKVNNDNKIIYWKKKGGVAVSGNLTDDAKEKVLKLSVKVVDKTISLSEDSLSANASEEESDGPIGEVRVGTKDIYGVPHYTIKGQNITGNNKKYTVTVLDADGKTIDAKKKLVFTTSDKSVATIKGKKVSGIWQAEITVKKNFSVESDDGSATVTFTAAEKASGGKYGKAAIYGNAAYLQMNVTPYSANPKISSLYAKVNGVKASKSALVIQAGESEATALLGAGYKSNAGSNIEVKWGPANGEIDGLDFTENPEKENEWIMTATKTMKNQPIKCTVSAKNSNGETIKEVKKTIKVTVTKRVDKVEVTSPAASGSTNYYASNTRTMVINGEKAKVRTFYYLAPAKKAVTDKIAAAEVHEESNIAPSNVKLKVVKNASDTDLASKVSVSAKQTAKNSPNYNVTLKVNKFAKGITGRHFAVYQIAAADSYNKTSKQYGVGEYIAICVTAVKEGSVINSGTVSVNMTDLSGNKVDKAIIDYVGANDRAYKLGFKANSDDFDDSTVGFSSDNENVVIVEVDEGSGIDSYYAVAKKSAGKANITATWMSVDSSGNRKIHSSAENNSRVVIHTVGTEIPEDVALKTTETMTISGNYIKTDADVKYDFVSQNVIIEQKPETKEQTVIVMSGNGVISANAIGTAKIRNVIRYSVSGCEVVSEKTTVIKVSGHEVAFDKTSYVADIKDGVVRPVITVDGKTVSANGTTLKLSVAAPGLATVSDNYVDIVPLREGNTSIKAQYYDANGYLAGTANAQFVITNTKQTDDEKYAGKTVISLNAVKSISANNASVMYKGTPEQLKNIYTNLKNKLGKSNVVNGTAEITISYNSVSGNTVSENAVSGNEADAAEAVKETVSEDESEAAVEEITKETAAEEKTEDQNEAEAGAAKDTAEPEVEETSEEAAGAESEAADEAEVLSGNEAIAEVSANETEAEVSANEADAEEKTYEDALKTEETASEENSEDIQKTEEADEEKAEAVSEETSKTAETAAEAVPTVIGKTVTISVTAGKISEESDAQIMSILNDIADTENVTFRISNVELTNISAAALIGQVNTAVINDDGTKTKYASEGEITFGGKTYSISEITFNRGNSEYSVKVGDKVYTFFIESDADNTRVIVYTDVTDDDIVKNLLGTKKIVTGATYYENKTKQ